MKMEAVQEDRRALTNAVARSDCIPQQMGIHPSGASRHVKVCIQSENDLKGRSGRGTVDVIMVATRSTSSDWHPYQPLHTIYLINYILPMV